MDYIMSPIKPLLTDKQLPTPPARQRQKVMVPVGVILVVGALLLASATIVSGLAFKGTWFHGKVAPFYTKQYYFAAPIASGVIVVGLTTTGLVLSFKSYWKDPAFVKKYTDKLERERDGSFGQMLKKFGWVPLEQGLVSTGPLKEKFEAYLFNTKNFSWVSENVLPRARSYQLVSDPVERELAVFQGEVVNPASGRLRQANAEARAQYDRSMDYTSAFVANAPAPSHHRHYHHHHHHSHHNEADAIEALLCCFVVAAGATAAGVSSAQYDGMLSRNKATYEREVNIAWRNRISVPVVVAAAPLLQETAEDTAG